MAGKLTWSVSTEIFKSKYFQETVTGFLSPSVDTSNSYFDEHFNKYHPKIPEKNDNTVYHDNDYHYPKPANHYEKPVVKPHRYSVANFEPEFFKQFYDPTEKQFIPVPVRSHSYQLQQKKKSPILKNTEPKKFAFPTFETF